MNINSPTVNSNDSKNCLKTLKPKQRLTKFLGGFIFISRLELCIGLFVNTLVIKYKL